MPATLTTAKLAHLLKVMLCNKRTYSIADKETVVYDDDGTTPLVTISEATVAGVATRTVVLAAIPDAADTDDDLDAAARVLVNLLDLTLASGVVEVYDDAGENVVLTLTPTEASGVVTVTPS